MELGSPTDTYVDLMRGGRTIARASGSEVRFDRIPSGGYTIRVTHGPKQLETQLRAGQDDTKITVTLPIAFIVAGLNQPISLSEIYMISSPLVMAVASRNLRQAAFKFFKILPVNGCYKLYPPIAISQEYGYRYMYFEPEGYVKYREAAVYLRLSRPSYSCNLPSSYEQVSAAQPVVPNPERPLYVK